MNNPLQSRTALETRVLVAFSTSVLVVVLLAGITWKVSRSALDAALAVAHTYRVLDVIADASRSVRRAESDVYSYYVTSEPVFLAQLDVWTSEMENNLRQIEQLTGDNPVQQENVKRLRVLLEARVALLSQGVLAHETSQTKEVRKLVLAARPKDEKGRIDFVVKLMEDEQRRLLKERTAEQMHASEIALATGAIAALVLAVLLSATYFLIRRQLRATEASRHALRESEESLSTTLHSIGDAVLATDTEGRVTRMNPVAERLTGWPFAEAQGRPVDEVFRIINEQTRTPAVVPVAKVLATGEMQGLANQTVLIARDGTERPVADSAAPIRDAAGRVSGVVLVFRDVTVKRRAERTIREQNELLEQRVRERTAQLRQSEERLNFALQMSRTGGWDLDLVDHTAHRTLEHDRIFGYRSLLPQWTYEMFLEHVLPEDRAEVDRRFRAATAAQTEWRFECRIRRADGEVRWILAAGEHQRDEAGQVRRMAGIVQDITERRHAEHEIRALNESLERRVAERTQQIEEANRAKSVFLANMSHELRTPLNAIIGFSETLKDGLLGELGAEQKSPVEDIFSSATHLLSLINDILDLSKVEAGKMALELEAVKPHGLLEASLAIVREKAMSSGIKLALEVPAPLPDIALDSRRTKQILFNLLSNAVKFTGKGGAVTLAARRAGRAEVRGQLAPEGRPFAEFLEIAVRDTGAGMTKAELGRLFQPFMQLDSSLERRHEGTGLGLAMVKQLVSLHGGAVWVESEPGKGSTFTVWLPWRTAAAQEAPLAQPAESAPGASTGPAVVAAAAAAIAQARSLRVLLVEDDAKAVELLRGELEREGLAVEVAATGAAALAMARADPPDLISLDLLLPDMDGWDLLARLKEEPGLAQVPVVILSVVADEKRGIAMGALRVLQKPVPRGELIAALSELGLIERRGTPPLVLVIDDEPKAVEILAGFLESVNCRVERAYGGAEGLATARARLPDLVILDLMMPEMSGFEVAAALKADAGTAAIPIIVVTAKLLSAEDRRQLQTQVVKVIEKGQLGREAFVAEVRRALAGRRKRVA